MEIYITRHGQTNWNIQHKVQGRTCANIPLNEAGISQVKELCNKTKKLNFAICYTSPLRRTVETAQIIVGKKCNILYDDRLIQRAFGHFDGKIVHNWVESIGVDIGNLRLNTKIDGIEPIKELLARTKAFLTDIKSHHRNTDKILIVTHSQTAKALHCNLVGYTDNLNWQDINYNNAEIRKYTV